jgi:tRNA nucleotidyltransferase (CCA-adding enzyme)
MSVKLDSAEAEFISYLDAFAATQQPPVTCRIAGGWVRDKVRPHHQPELIM